MARKKLNLSNPGDSTHFGSDDLDYVNYLFDGQDQSSTNPIDMNTSWKYRTQKLVFRDPTNTYSSTVVNPSIASDSAWQFNSSPDFYIFIDPDDGNKYKARDGRTGAIYSSHATDASIPIQAAIDYLYNNAAWGTGDNLNLPVGGRYGKIFVGPGIYYFNSAVILKSYIELRGCGPMATVFTFPNGLYPSKNNNTLDIFKSYTWDFGSINGGVTTPQDYRHRDLQIILRDFQIYGNYKNNVIPDANTATITYPSGVETAGTDSWGHGIAIYGTLCQLDNLYVHGCPGAGIILQDGGGGLGSGYPYPIAPPLATGGTGTGLYGYPTVVRNVASWGNGRQGLLVRSLVYVDNYWAYFNGEGGIDMQACQYFSGSGWVQNIEVFEDGYKHGDQTSLTYDPYGFEARLRSCWCTNLWIEAPYGPGDNLVIGMPATASTTGYQIGTGASDVFITNAYIDHSRWNAILIGQGAHDNHLKNISAFMKWDASPSYRGISPLKVLGGFNDIELHWTGYNSAQGSDPLNTVTGVILGSQSPSVYGWGNSLKLYCENNDYAITNQNSNNYCQIDLNFINTTAGTKTILDGTVTPSLALDYTKIKLKIERMGGTGNLSHNGGLATFSGTGTTTAFTIAHSLFDVPTVVEVVPNTVDARGSFIVTADATNITVTYPVAPPSGTNNVKLYWTTRVGG